MSADESFTGLYVDYSGTLPVLFKYYLVNVPATDFNHRFCTF
jgi:hypothetical protein